MQKYFTYVISTPQMVITFIYTKIFELLCLIFLVVVCLYFWGGEGVVSVYEKKLSFWPCYHYMCSGQAWAVRRYQERGGLCDCFHTLGSLPKERIRLPHQNEKTPGTEPQQLICSCRHRTWPRNTYLLSATEIFSFFLHRGWLRQWVSRHT